MREALSTSPVPRWLERALRWGIWVLVAVVLAVGLWTVDDYGASTDEPWRMLWTRRWWATLGSGSTAGFGEMPQNYGVLYDSLGRALWLLHRELGGTDEFLARHVLNLVTGCSAIVGIHHLARALLRNTAIAARWEGALVPLLASALLAASPRFYGSMFTNPKDVPFAAATIWAAWGAVRLAQAPSRPNAVVAGVLAGLCAAVRPHGVVFFFLAAIAATLTDPTRRGALRAVLVVAVAYAVCFVAWPVLWAQPPWHLLTAMMELTRHDHGSQSLFAGQVYPFSDAPALYVVGWLAITLPAAVCLLAPFGLGRALGSTVRGPVALGQRFGWGLLALWVLVPAVLPMLRKTTLYDATRQFLFMVPPLCLLAALGWAGLRRRLARGRWLLDLLLLASTLGAAAQSVALHPYQSVYVSGLAGGLRGAEGSFDLAHYSQTYREAFDWLRRRHRGAAVHVVGNGSAVASFYAWKYGLDLNPERFEFFVSEVRQGWETTLPGTVVHTIERDGVALLEIRKVAPMRAAQVAWLRPGPFNAHATGPDAGHTSGWIRLDANGGQFDVLQHLDGGPGVLAIELHAREPMVASLLSCHYLSATLAVDGTVIYEGAEVPFHYRGTENFPSLLPVEVSLVAGRQWLLVDVSDIRQAWKYGVYAPEGGASFAAPGRPSD